MRRAFGILAASVGFVVLVAPVMAHHGFDTEYDAKKKFKLEGVVSQVLWTNPHMRVHVDVTDAAGKVTTYNMELTSPNSVQRQGWGRSSLVPGDKVVFEGYGGKVVESRGSLLSIAKQDAPNKPLFVQGGPDAAAEGFPGQR
ncbi:MAG: hypothetical protein HOP16_09965 [Acidobacteria bacterium]|nr:hypothetical protein [Acidobacteriota bacterium]